MIIGSSLDSLLLLATPLLPLLAAAGLAERRWRARVAALAPWLSLPALLTAVLVSPGTELELPGVLLGMRFGMDESGRTFLLFSAIVWGAASLYARDELRVFVNRGQDD